MGKQIHLLYLHKQDLLYINHLYVLTASLLNKIFAGKIPSFID